MAKTEFQLRDIAKILEKSAGAFQDPPLVSAPNSDIVGLDGQPRQLPDPSKTLKPAFGIERIMFNSVNVVDDERSTDNRLIYELDNKDPRIRFIAPIFPSDKFGGTRIGAGLSFNSGDDSTLEVTFWGTALNILVALGTSGTRGFSVEVDGVPEPDIFAPTDNVLYAQQNTRANHVLSVKKGLTLGLHTAKITILNNGSLSMQGVEIINEEDDISIPKGEVFSRGRRYVQSQATTTPYNSGFDGNPVLNGGGGCASIYKKPDDEAVYKVLNQAVVNPQYLASADHSNEVAVRKINFRDFGANRGDDFSTLTTGVSAGRAYTLEDGVTTLVGHDVTANTSSGSREYLSPQALNALITFTFVGTGLDFVITQGTGAIDAQNFFIDGEVQGTLSGTGNGQDKVLKIVSGLEYGTHTVTMQRTAFVNGFTGIHEFIVYAPKKPEIPADALEIGEYYLMADYDSSSIINDTNELQIPEGVLLKSCMKELNYDGTGHTTNLQIALKQGWDIFTGTVSDSFSYTFFGTGIYLGMAGSSGGTYDFTIEVDGVLEPAATIIQGNSNLGGGSYRNTLGFFPSISPLEITGLDLGVHTVTITKTAGGGNMAITDMGVITPVHFPNTASGSLALGNTVPVLQQSEESSVDLGKAKAWVSYNPITGEILKSHNVSAIVDVATGIFQVHFEKSFKDADYILAGAGARYGTATNQQTVVTFNTSTANTAKEAAYCTIVLAFVGGSLIDHPWTAVFFGELEGEGE